MCEGGLADSKLKCITVIKPRCDEGLDYCLKVLLCRKGLHLCQLPKVKGAGLNDETNLLILFKIKVHPKIQL